MSVYMYVCVYVCMHGCIYVCIYVCMHVQGRICILRGPRLNIFGGPRIHFSKKCSNFFRIFEKKISQLSLLRAPFSWTGHFQFKGGWGQSIFEKKFSQLSLLRTPFSWTGHFSRKKFHNSVFCRHPF